MASAADDQQPAQCSEPVKRSIVARPVCEIPRARNTLKSVSHRIRTSSRKERCSTYQTSSSNFVPAQCVAPVHLCPSGDSRANLVTPPLNGGVQGKILHQKRPRTQRLISPRRTLINSGNSSRLVFRRILPNSVSRSVSGRAWPAASVSSRMVRNLRSVNGLPSRPGTLLPKEYGRTHC